VIPFFRGADVEAAVSPQRALEAVREAFVAYARGEWSMPPKVYVPAYPAGDFRAMPALGARHALLKWVTSFPGNPAAGLPTVTGLVVLSDASNGMPKAILDAAAVTALRTGAAAVLAAETLGRPDAAAAAVVGALDDPRLAALTLQELATVQEELGHLEDAIAGYRRLLSNAERIDDLAGKVQAHLNLGRLLRYGEPGEARHHLEQALLGARELGDSAAIERAAALLPGPIAPEAEPVPTA
jgi:tetratricopeptide (TPR) repeat protein